MKPFRNFWEGAAYIGHSANATFRPGSRRLGAPDGFLCAVLRTRTRAFRYIGIAGASDETLYEAFYSSGRTDWVGGMGKDAQLLDDNRALVAPCPKPSALVKTTTGVLPCFAESVFR